MAAAGGGGGGARRGLLKRKPNFTLQEIDILMSEVLKYEQLLFGAAASTVNAYEKQKIWWRITNKINAAGRNQRDIGEVKNRWRGLRRRANDKITRHRQERQGPTARSAPRPGNGNGNGNGSGPGPPELGPGPAPGWGQRGAAAGMEPPVLSVEVAAPHGVKGEAVKEEPVEVKTEPFPGPGPERRPPRSGLRSPAEKRIVQSNERLVQEVRAFRREYAESRRETSGVLRLMAQALGGLSRSLAEIRDLYLQERGVPKP